MNLLVGLGNKGDSYQRNRHNVGFVFVDRVFGNLKEEGIYFSYSKKFDSLICQTNDLILAKPQTMMNYSGISVSKIVSFYKIPLSKFWLAYDDLDIPLGQYKMVFDKPPKTHKGVFSVIDLLGSSSFWHIRIGVDNRSKENKEKGEEYVLKNFLPSEEEIIGDVIENAASDFLKRVFLE